MPSHSMSSMDSTIQIQILYKREGGKMNKGDQSESVINNYNYIFIFSYSSYFWVWVP